ncbi:MAG: Spy/CpxP family protein refolding chaperone [Kofleriaceae bacterium]
MNRIRIILTVVLPSMIAGGFLFGAAFSQAASNDSDDVWSPAPVVIAQADPPKPVSPVPPTAPGPGPKPPKPPEPPKPVKPVKPAKPAIGGGSGISVSIDNGVVQVTGIRDIVKSQLDGARGAISGNQHIPADVKKKILARLDKIGSSVDKRLVNLKLTDLAKLDDELEEMGEEIEEALEGLGDDLDALGDAFGKNFKFDISKLHIDHDDDNDDDNHDIPSAPDVGDADDDDMRDAINDLKDLALNPQQRDQITKLRSDSDKQVAASKQQIDELSTKLHTALGNSAVTDAEIGKLVDQISGHEAAMRKARIVAWAQARRMLDTAQRKRVEAAAAKAKKTK